jgi:superfamily II DNA/RNA helicase
MATTLEELRVSISTAIAPGFRAQLLARGQSRAMIWRGGVLPPDSPEFSPGLSSDLLSFAYTLLAQNLRFVELDGEVELSRAGFEAVAEALEAVVAKGAHDEERDFHRLVAAAAFHLGGFSARSYSLLRGVVENANLSPMEMCLAKLMQRDMLGLSREITAWFDTGSGTDEAVIAALEVDTNDSEQASVEARGLALAVEGNYMAAVSMLTLALERGDSRLAANARERLTTGASVAAEIQEVAMWWCNRLSAHFVGGLWNDSFHNILPSKGPQDGEEEWERLRRLFIASLYRRGKSEIELWPSQILAARKVLHFDTNLVLSLPTSAGKTRIAELCILACLAQKRRVVFVTPLRALSAQTEVGLRKTFEPLGKTVSSLYGSIGVHSADMDTMRTRDIVVATPEKLDFALRSNPELLDDVGLVVLDEGHMIGLEEREVRYEAQIQRLLRRVDTKTRRIICLSAILPDGDQLEDFSAWLTGDNPEGLIKSQWRPTRLRYGEVEWLEDHARLNITVGTERPFVPRFLTHSKPLKKTGRKLFPSNQSELCIATAWRLVGDGQTVLIFCPLRASVLPLATCVIEMHRRGHIMAVLNQSQASLETALSVGAEWFGADHDILKCLKLGVAVHHGALPTPYRKEVERLLREGTLKVTISSPTLAQGLNLTATSLVFHGLFRNAKLIPIAEFRNVVGRAGRAYIDVEGLVLYPMFDDLAKRRSDWNALVTSQESREMESGLLRLVYTLLLRIRRKTGARNVDDLIEYIGGQGGWDFPALHLERAREADEARRNWPKYLMSLDTAIFSLLGDAEVPDDEIEARLDEVLASSLFERRIARQDNESWKVAIREGLAERAKHIWKNTTAAQRRGYFLAGVGLVTGKALDEHAPALEALLHTANVAISAGADELAIQAITEFAELAFTIPPFTPKNLFDGWKNVLRSWLLGLPLDDILGKDDEVIEFIEQTFVYRLPWAMEAVRVRAAAHVEALDDAGDAQPKLAEFSSSAAVWALETGTLNISAAVILRSGFQSRTAAIKAVKDTGATFESPQDMKRWLQSLEIQKLGANIDWPSPKAHKLWLTFAKQEVEATVGTWTIQSYSVPVQWAGVPMPPGAPLRLSPGQGGQWDIFNAEHRLVGTMRTSTPATEPAGLFLATATGAPNSMSLEYIGP